MTHKTTTVKSDLSLINRSASEGILSIDEAVTAARSKRSDDALHALDTTIARVRYARLAMDLRVESIRAEDAPDGFALARARRKLEILARRLDGADDFA